MVCLDPNSELGRAIRAGKLRAVKVKRRPGEDAAGAYIRNMVERSPEAWKAFVDRLDQIIKESEK